MRDTTNWKMECTKCGHCEKEFTAPLWRKQKFCSYSCARYKTVWNKGKHNPFATGENHYLWKKDRSTLVKKQERNDMAYKEWRKMVVKRDEYKCKMNNSECCGKIIVHHILPWRDYENLRYEVNNGICLCKFHHPRKRKDEMRLSPYFQEIIKNPN